MYRDQRDRDDPKRWDDERAKEFVRGLLKLLLSAAVLYLVLVIVPPFAIRWYDCQQLAPAERFFTRGC